MSSPTPPMSALKLALLAKQARTQTSLARSEPVAIVGIGCRFPGGADSPEEFWRVLHEGMDTVGEIPTSRWDLDAQYDPDPSTPGKSSIRHAALLERIDAFDAAFFGILPREAARMDPQQRIVMEVAIDALDHAGFNRQRLAGSRTGVYIASYHTDYAQLQYADPDWIDPRTLTGILQSVIANRLSYWLDLRGPSLSLDSACSSSLVAVHLACQSLRTGETDIGIAGGVNVIAAPELMVPLSKLGVTSPTGRCRTFDAAADGFVRGEGCGVVVLRRLSDAVAAGERVLAVIRGTAVNQDGHSTVMAAPNGLAQQAMIREALENARIEPSRVGLVEAHGTGTPLGDPIEVEALAATLGAPRTGGGVCHVGSAKANIGHLEAAAGVAGLIKVTLALRHGEIPGQPHFRNLNPHLTLAGTCLRIAETPQPWLAGSLPRVAAVSSFGLGGTNAHVIVEEAPALPADVQAADPPQDAFGPVLLPLSAQSRNALRALAERWSEFLPRAAAGLGAVCTAAGQRRSHYDFRLGLVGSTVAQMQERLQAFLADTVSPGVVAGHCPAAGNPRLAFVFCGQGPQWFAMGRELAATEPVFRDTLAHIDALLRAQASWSLLEELAMEAAHSRLSETQLAQPAIFAIQVALATLWKSWGVEPDAVVGHSIGELAALHLAGVLSLEEAVRVVWQRARAMQRATGLGGMASVGVDITAAEELVLGFGDDLSIGAINSPRSIVLSGRKESLAAALHELERRGVSHRVLPVNYAFHSAQMETIAAEFAASLGSVAAVSSRLPVYSTVSGCTVGAGEIDAAYFRRNVRQSVCFAAAIETMLADGFTTFLEIGPHPVLGSSIAECAAARGAEITLLASLRRNRPERESMLQACAGVFNSAREPRWEVLNRGPAASIDLPAYPWQRERHWLRERPPAGAAVVATGNAAALSAGSNSELLGERLGVAAATVFSITWPHRAPAWLADHRVAGKLLLPAAAMLESLRAAACDALATQDIDIADFVVHRPLVLSEPGGSEVTWQVAAHEPVDARVKLTLHERIHASGRPARWHLIATAEAALASGRTAAVSSDPPTIAGGGPATRVAQIYTAFARLGVNFGAEFQTLLELQCVDGGAVGWLERPGGPMGQREGAPPVPGVHATLLDGALQLCVAAATGGAEAIPREILLPLGVDHYRVFRPAPTRVHVRAELRRDRSDGALVADVQLRAPNGDLVALLEGARLAPVSREAMATLGQVDDWLYEIEWQQSAPAAGSAGAPGAWIVLCDVGGVGDALAEMLASSGALCLRVRAGRGRQLLEPGLWSIDPSDPTHWEALLTDDSWRNRMPLTGVVHLWSLDVTAFGPARDSAPDFATDDMRTSGSALLLLQSLVRGASSRSTDEQPRLVFVTSGAQPAGGGVTHRPAAAGLWGFVSAAAAELPDLPCRIIDLDSDVAPDTEWLARELAGSHHAPRRLAVRGSKQLVPRLRRFDDSARVPMRLYPGDSRTLDSLEWRPYKAPDPAADEARVRVVAAGVNFRDVLLTLGMYPNSAGVPLGGECAGVVEAVGSAVSHVKPGDRVFGFAPASVATQVTVPAGFLARVPPSLTMEQAAALPAAYLTALLGLHRIANMRAGMRVLIHAAAGGVGMAAVRLASRAGAEVFATAGSPAKRELLRSLGVQHVFDSRSTSFADGVHRATDGVGVDIVLNSLAGEFIAASFGVLRAGGWFLELGKRDIWSVEQVARLRPDVRYRAYDLGTEAYADRELLPALMTELVAAIEAGELCPLPIRVFDFSDAPVAFRLMAQARHVGKLVLRAPRAVSSELPIRPEASYLITGGLGAVGIRTARWLVESGARHLILTGRRLPGPDAEVIIRECERRGAQFTIRAVDASDARAMEALFAEIRRDLPPLRGVIHAAGSIDDGVLLQQDLRRWERVLSGKAHGARLLHALTSNMPLDFFVLYSASGLLLGPAGQGPYAAANAELDALAHARRAVGLPALSVAWGMWSEAGMAASLAARGQDTWSARGLGWISPAQGFAHLERALGLGVAHVAVMPIDWARFAAGGVAGADRDFLAGLIPASQSEGRTTGTAARPGISRVEQWRKAPQVQRLTLVTGHVTESALSVLGLNANTVLEPRAALKDAGLDSLMAVELRNALTRSIGQSLPATLLFDYPSIESLATYLMRVLDLNAEESAPHAARASAAAVAALSEAEAEAQLLAELSGGARRSAS